jgi:putative transposase
MRCGRKHQRLVVNGERAVDKYLKASQIAALKLPGLPTDKSAVIRRAEREKWPSRKSSGNGGGFEYPLTALPIAAREELIERELRASRPARPPAHRTVDAGELKHFQRSAMEARAALLAEIDLLVLGGHGQSKAIDALIDMAAAGTLSPELQRLVPVANARAGEARALSRTTVYRWIRERTKADGNAVALAPASMPQAPVPAWAQTFLERWGRPGKPGVPEILEDWPEGIAKPSVDQVRRFLKRLDVVTKNKGRMGPRALQALKVYVARDASELWPGAIFIGDGHTMKEMIAHPRSGRPFRPEVTAILDVFTRRWVGWSTALAENTMSVADALKHAVMTTTQCAIFYYDNGGGANNQQWDDTTTGLAARLGITKLNSAAWTSQSRGVIERFNQTLHKIARRSTSYVGQRMDNEARRAVDKLTKKDIIATGASPLLPTLQEFVAKLDEEQARYNDRPHDSLPKIIDPATGKRRHISPNEMWAKSVAEGWTADPLSLDDARDLFRPEIVCTTTRGLVQWIGNSYFSPELEAFGGEQVVLGYDIHDASRVWVRHLDGRFICEAEFEGNKRAYVPVSFAQHAEQKRLQSQLDRVEKRRDNVLANAPQPLIDHAPISPMPVSIDDELRAEAVLARIDPPTADIVPIAVSGVRWPGGEDERMAWLAANPDQVTAADLSWIDDRCRSGVGFGMLWEDELKLIRGGQRISAAG